PICSIIGNGALDEIMVMFCSTDDSLEATFEPLPSRFSVTNSEDWFWTCSYSKIGESSTIGASCISFDAVEGNGCKSLEDDDTGTFVPESGCSKCNEFAS